MRRLRMTNRMLSVVLVAAGARAIVSGPRSGVVIVGTIVALLLLASLLLTRHGSRLDPRTHAGSTARRLPPRRDLSNLEQIEIERFDLGQNSEQR